MALTQRLPPFSLSCVSYLLLLFACVAMAETEVFTPGPPPEPPECVDPNIGPMPPSGKWLEDYFGTPSGGGGGGGLLRIDGIEGLWTPPGLSLEYIGFYDINFGDNQQDPPAHYINVPTGEIWLLRMAEVEFDLDQNSATKFPIMTVYDNTNDIAVFAGTADLNGGSTQHVVWAPVPTSVTPDKQWATVAIPPQLYLQPGWGVQVNLIGTNGDASNFARFQVEKWKIGSGGGGGTSGGGGGSGGGSGFGGPYFSGPG